MALGIIKELRETMLEWITNIGTPSRPTDAYYIQWHTADPGVAGSTAISTALAGRDVLAGTSPFWQVGTAGDGIVENKTAGESSAATGSQTITHFSIWNASTVGTCYCTGDLASGQAVTSGGKLTYEIGDLTLTMTGAA